jgi:hypothetical protein
MTKTQKPKNAIELAHTLNQTVCNRIIGAMYGVYYPWRKSGDLYIAMDDKPIHCCQCDRDILVDKGLESWREHIKEHAHRKLVNPILFMGSDNNGKPYTAQEKLKRHD